MYLSSCSSISPLFSCAFAWKTAGPERASASEASARPLGSQNKRVFIAPSIRFWCTSDGISIFNRFLEISFIFFYLVSLFILVYVPYTFWTLSLPSHVNHILSHSFCSPLESGYNALMHALGIMFQYWIIFEIYAICTVHILGFRAQWSPAHHQKSLAVSKWRSSF